MKNPVAKHARKFNKSSVMRDRKKDDKRGYTKHKGKQLNSDAQQTDTSGHTNSAAKRPQNYTDPETGKVKTRLVPVKKDIQTEKLNPSDGIKAYIKDFQQSDAPQFKGKSMEKRREMAIAAYLDAKRGTKESVDRCVFDEIMEGFGALDESQKLAKKRAELRKKMFGDANYLTPAQRKELDKAAKAELKKEREVKKATPAPKSTTKTSKGKIHTGSADPADRNIFMQLRKAQDRGGNQSVTVSPTGKKVTLNQKQIDLILKKHDSIQKPVDKRKFKIMLIKSLRSKAK